MKHARMNFSSIAVARISRTCAAQHQSQESFLSVDSECRSTSSPCYHAELHCRRNLRLSLCSPTSSRRRIGTTISSSIFVGWSCCKDIDEHSLGCMRKAKHIEDKTFSRFIQGFKGVGETQTSADMERRVDEARRAAEEEERMKVSGRKDGRGCRWRTQFRSS